MTKEHDNNYLFYKQPQYGAVGFEVEGDITEKEFALETLERYSGCSPKLFQPNILFTNFPTYVEFFAKENDVEIFEGSMFKVVHAKKVGVTMLDFKIGSPAAALAIDLTSFLPLRSCILLGMCGGLRRRYKVGDYIVPVASIRDEGTSNHYFPPEVPALSNFLVNRAISEILEEKKKNHHIGITYTTNMRFWEFNKPFKERLMQSKAQAIEMECATLFCACYRRKTSLSALLLVSDKPLDKNGVKTKKRAQSVFEKFMKEHIDLGVLMIERANQLIDARSKGLCDRSVYKKN